MIRIHFVQADENAKLPTYSSAEAAGADVYSVESCIINPGDNRLIDTGLDCVIPPGYELQVRPRSGMAFKSKVTVLNTPGTVDSDYAGRLRVNLMNFGSEPYAIETGARIAQIVVAPVIQGAFSWTYALRETERGSNGFGSTGV